MTDSAIKLASEIIAEGRPLDAIRFMRTNGATFQTARKYCAEIAGGAPWMKRAIHRAKRESANRVRRKL